MGEFWQGLKGKEMRVYGTDIKDGKRFSFMFNPIAITLNRELKPNRDIDVKKGYRWESYLMHSQVLTSSENKFNSLGFVHDPILLRWMNAYDKGLCDNKPFTLVLEWLENCNAYPSWFSGKSQIIMRSSSYKWHGVFRMYIKE